RHQKVKLPLHQNTARRASPSYAPRQSPKPNRLQHKALRVTPEQAARRAGG
ncbi:hypothetical protein A2U01_0093295, partial [Trifolium medium]|nr:hypothetical protein [Trifolium medium]